MARMCRWAGLLGGLQLVGATFAQDVPFVPLADTPPKKHVEHQVIYIDKPLGAASGGVLLNNTYYGLTDRLELFQHSAVFAGVPGSPPAQWQLNTQYRIVDSRKPRRPNVAIGAYNLTGGNFLNYTGIQPYVVGSYSLNVPGARGPRVKDPLVRVSAGIGTQAHGAFGDLLVVWDKHFATSVGNHGGHFHAAAQFMFGNESQFHVTPAYWAGSFGVKVAYQHQF